MRKEILKEIISDKDLMEKYNIKEKDLNELTTSFLNSQTVVEVMSTIINGSDNNMSNSQIYKRIKNIHKI